MNSKNRKETINGWATVLGITSVVLLLAAGWCLAAAGQPPGMGVVQAGEERYLFQVVGCEIGEVRGPSGYTWEIWLLGKGRHEGRDFFVELERGKRDGVGQASLRLHWTALPTGWYHGGPAASERRVEEDVRVRMADGLEALSRWGLLPEQVVVEGSRIRVAGPVRLLRLRQGRGDEFVSPGALEAVCVP